MTRKHRHVSSLVDQSYGFVHPTLAHHRTDGTAAAASESSVNERLEYLRSVQRRARMASTSDELLQSTHAPAQVKRRMAGPPPPRSWLENKRLAQSKFIDHASDGLAGQEIDYFPGVTVPKKGSLTDIALRTLASQWHAQVAYQAEWLSTLPSHLKTLLLSYIARYGPADGVSVDDLCHVMSGPADTGSVESTGCQAVVRLDLRRALGRNMTIKSLRTYLLSSGGTDRKPPVKPHDEPLESWEDSEDAPVELLLPSLQINGPTTPFCAHLTHLSLADPGEVTWPDLVDKLSPRLRNLTHLSLANWPSPLPPYPSFQTKQVAYSHFHTEEDMNIEGRHRLHILSRNTCSLQYLSLRGCGDWMHLLSSASAPIAAPTSSRRVINAVLANVASNFDTRPASVVSGKDTSRQKGRSLAVDWAGDWGQITTLDLWSEWVPGPHDVPLVTLVDTLRKRTGRRLNSGSHANEDDSTNSNLPTVDTVRFEREYDFIDLPADTRHAHLFGLRTEPRNWILREHQKSRLARWVRAARAASRQRQPAWLEVVWGCDDVAALEAAGWDEGELFAAGVSSSSLRG